MSTLDALLTFTPMALSFVIFFAMEIIIVCKKLKCKLWISYFIIYAPCYIIDIFTFIFVPNTADEVVLPMKIVALIVPIVYATINCFSSKKKYYVCDENNNIVEEE